MSWRKFILKAEINFLTEDVGGTVFVSLFYPSPTHSPDFDMNLNAFRLNFSGRNSGIMANYLKVLSKIFFVWLTFLKYEYLQLYFSLKSKILLSRQTGWGLSFSKFMFNYFFFFEVLPMQIFHELRCFYENNLMNSNKCYYLLYRVIYANFTILFLICGKLAYTFNRVGR